MWGHIDGDHTFDGDHNIDSSLVSVWGHTLTAIADRQ